MAFQKWTGVSDKVKCLVRNTMMIAVGDKHFINSDYIVEILYPVDRRANRLARAAAGNQRLINAAGGDRVRSIIRLKRRFTVLSALEVKTLKSMVRRTCLRAGY